MKLDLKISVYIYLPCGTRVWWPTGVSDSHSLFSTHSTFIKWSTNPNITANSCIFPLKNHLQLQRQGVKVDSISLFLWQQIYLESGTTVYNMIHKQKVRFTDVCSDLCATFQVSSSHKLLYKCVDTNLSNCWSLRDKF